jgi:GMP synthase (glutamine-hydrolysing)
VPDIHCDQVKPSDDGAEQPSMASLSEYDAIFLTGSPLHVYNNTPEVRRQLEFMRAVFASCTPSFGSCGSRPSTRCNFGSI